MSMVELFDLFAGSESGAILASTLAIKNKKANSTNQTNEYFADKVVKFYESEMNIIYKDN
jgi:patatin-like phospholipase/acyl hydrolase